MQPSKPRVWVLHEACLHRFLHGHEDPAQRKKIKADTAKDRGREGDPCSFDHSYLLERKEIGTVIC